MTKIAIAPVQTKNGNLFFNAIAGNKQTKGKTAGEALDALSEQLGEEEGGTLIIVQNYRSDHFFGVRQQKRLDDLMVLWRTARDKGVKFPLEKQKELDSLVELELLASAKRATELNNELNK